jgi:hypothetical protein
MHKITILALAAGFRFRQQLALKNLALRQNSPHTHKALLW